MKIVFSAWSLRELEEHYNYLNALNPRAAARIHNKLLDSIEKLAAQPLMGRIEPSLEHLQSFARWGSGNDIKRSIL